MVGLIIYREAKWNPADWKLRTIDEGELSFYTSVGRLKPGERYVAVNTADLPPGSYRTDPSDPEHVFVKASENQYANRDFYKSIQIETGIVPEPPAQIEGGGNGRGDAGGPSTEGGIGEGHPGEHELVD